MRRVWTALSIVYVVWGSTYLAIRIGVETLPPFLMSGVRFLVAGAALFVWDRLAASKSSGPGSPAPGPSDHRRTSPRGEWAGALLIGGLLLLGGTGCVVWGESHHVASGVTALIFATLPMWMALLSFVLYRERLNAAVLFGLVLGFAGIALLVGGVSGGASGPIPPLVVLIGAFSWSLGSVLTRWAPLPERQMRSTAMQMLCGGALLLTAGVGAGELGRLHLAQVTTRSWLALAYLILIGSLVGFTAYTWLLSNARISLVSTYAYVNPLVALFLGWVFVSETISVRTFVASAIVIVAVAMVVTARSRGRSAEPDARAALASVERP
jgi:drug/metabolite transporter (DMT)-like permease